MRTARIKMRGRSCYTTRGSFFERPRWIQAVSFESFFENRMIFSITYT